MEELQKRIGKAIDALQRAEGLVIGGGAGLSSAAGLVYEGARFEKNFKDFIEIYDMQDMYSASFYPFSSEEEKWAYWARHIDVNVYQVEALPLYKKLYEFLHHKPYVVITTNVDEQFQKAGFDIDKLFEVQGSYGYIQCAKGCHDKLYRNQAMVKRMREETNNCRIPHELVPKCPMCGGNMEVHVRKDAYFVQPASWERQYHLYEAWIQKMQDKRVVYIELGVGFNTPGIIRYPFETMVYHNPKATLLRFNKEYAFVPNEIHSQSICFVEPIEEIMEHMKEAYRRNHTWK